MDYKIPAETSGKKLTPRIIIHGGAGNITPSNLPKHLYVQFHSSLLTIVAKSHHYLLAGHDALDTVSFAVEQLENNPLFNSGKGAVFTRDGLNELEVSVMVSRGKKKRGVGLMGLKHVKNPIMLAREMLIRGEDDLNGGNGEHRGPMFNSSSSILSLDGGSSYQPPSGGAQGHSQMHGEGAEKLARKWGLEMVEPSYFFTQNRWDEHVAGLEREKSASGSGMATWDAEEYVSQGTCGAVAMDADGVVAVATSTGGMTNKLTGRIGDTPTLGAGFWAEEWEEACSSRTDAGPVLILSDALKGMMADCLPSLTIYTPLASPAASKTIRSTGISGTGNGDSFLRMNAVRTASAIARYRGVSLQKGMAEMTGPGGELQKSAGDRWKKTGEGEGGMIGIECVVSVDEEDGEVGMVRSARSEIVEEYNCGGMFRALVNEDGKAVCRVWREGQYDDVQDWGEGREYNVQDWLGEKV